MPYQSQADRRAFLRTASLAGAGFWVAGTSIGRDSTSPNEKLNIAVIGCGGKGEQDLEDVSGENIVALCDVDQQQAKNAFKKYSHVRKFADYRQMFDQMHGQIDAVTVSTPDHTHAPAGLMAMRLGKHLFCQKPLSHSIHESRLMRQTAAENNVATQMGNQGTAKDSFRTAVEMLQAAVIGKVREVHVWTDRPTWPQGVDRPEAPCADPCHAELGFMAWPRTTATLSPDLCPARLARLVGLRHGGTGRHGLPPDEPGVHGAEARPSDNGGSRVVAREFRNSPTWSIICYEFPARGDLPPLKLTWYDGGKLPPAELLPGRKLSPMGELFIGDRGMIYNQDLLPEADFVGYKPPQPSLPRSPGHHAEWIRACKGGPPAMSNFDYAAQLTEMVLLGNVALRVGKKIHWDGDNMKCIDCPEADQYIRPSYREGWAL